MKGASFIIETEQAENVFIREDLTEEQKLMAETARDFVAQEVSPNLERIDRHDFEFVLQLLNRAADLGLLGAGLPEEYGGLGIDFNAESAISEEIGAAHSFSVSIAAHTGIGTLPILYFGTEEQKKKYLPRLANGALKASYCLTEPDSGSDALAAKTKAVLDADGKHYIINGQKMWITNAGFADLFIVFAKIDGDKFTGFIVERNSPGISLGEEEEKMGIKGSSTRQVFFENVKVPVENLLGEIGKGHRIAFNVLNIGRYKLANLVLGGCKQSTSQAIKYANERFQFGKAIASFGAIRHKLAEMAIKTFVLESAVYRTSGYISNYIQSEEVKGIHKGLAKLEAAEEYSIECAMLKVFGSEALDYCVDELVQIYGGMGFSEHAPAARSFRDSRINRIFEGTNEINRLLTVGQLMRKALKGELDLMSPAMAIQKELMSIPDFSTGQSEDPLAAEKKYISNAKKAFLLTAGAAVQKYMMKLEEQQEILMHLADMLISIYTMESALLRIDKKFKRIDDGRLAVETDMLRCYISDGMEEMNLAGRRAICGFASGDELRMLLLGIKRFTKTEPYNTVEARRRIAERLVVDGQYSL